MKYLIFTSFIFISWHVQCQKISPVLFSSSGGFSKTENISLHWAIGELAVNNFRDHSIKLNEGFYQGNILISSPEITSLSNIKIYPNPTTYLLNISDPDNQIQKVFLYDLNGRNVLKIKEYLNELTLLELPNGIYLLRIVLATDRILDYKIVKI